ncbi:MAG: methylmalonyl-CoA epimerase [Chloroflexota bacterium]
MFKRLDHIAIAVHNTDKALTFYRDVLGLTVVFSEQLSDNPVRLTHLDMGNTHLQLVEPLTDDHPLQEWLDQHGEGLHHFCFYVDSVKGTLQQLPSHGMHAQDSEPRSGPNGRQAAFISQSDTHGVLIEITSEPQKDATQ